MDLTKFTPASIIAVVASLLVLTTMGWYGYHLQLPPDWTFITLGGVTGGALYSAGHAKAVQTIQTITGGSNAGGGVTPAASLARIEDTLQHPTHG